MSQTNPETAEPALAFDESAMRQFVEKSNPELIADDPAGGGVTPSEPDKLPEGNLDDPPADEPAKTDPPIDDAAEVQRKKDEADAAAKKLADDEAAKKTAAAPAPHPDLEELEKGLDPHTKPKTRQVITKFKGEATAARERATKAEQERAAAVKERDDLQAQIKSGKPPKEIEDELTTLRERVRELDVSKDPQIEAKYDKPISANTDAAIAMLGEYGLFKVGEVDGDGKATGKFRDMTEKEKNGVTAQLKAGGVSLRTMAQHISRLEKSGDVEGAEQLRDLARENDRLAREKTTEITQIKGNYEGRAQARTKEQQAAQEQISTITRTTSEKTLQADIAELAKSYPAIGLPPEPLATDSAAVVAAKKAAITEYKTAADQVTEAVKTFNSAGLPPEKAAEAQGRMTAAAVKAVILQNHVLPKMVKESAAKDARIKELEAQVGKFRTAGGLNRAHAASINANGNNAPAPAPAGVPLVDAARDFFKTQGVDVNS